MTFKRLPSLKLLALAALLAPAAGARAQTVPTDTPTFTPTQTPLPTATPYASLQQSGSLVLDGNSNAKADPGDEVGYSIRVGAPNGAAIGVSLTVGLDAAEGQDVTVSASPLALDDSYSTYGNVSLTVVAPGVLANDRGFFGESFSISAYDATTVHGGSVSLAIDGSFTYKPAVGYSGPDSFTYTLSNPSGLSGQGTVNVNVAHRIWFVDNSRPGGGDGSLDHPFNTLVLAAAAANAANDAIYVAKGDGTSAGLSAHVALLAGQQLVGSNADLAFGGVIAIPSTQDGGPLLSSPSSPAIQLANGTLVAGLTVQGVTGVGVSGSAVSNITLSQLTISACSSWGLALYSLAGSVSVTQTALLGNGAGLQVSGGAAAYQVTLTALSGGSAGPLASVQSLSGNGRFNFGAVSSASAKQGLVLISAPGHSFQAASLDLILNAGAGAGNFGLKADGTGPLSLLGNCSISAQTGETAVYLNNVSLNAPAFSLLDAFGASAAPGVYLSNLNGAFGALAGSISGRSAGNAFEVAGGSSNISYGGSISSGVGNSPVKVAGRSGGSVRFDGPVSGLGSNGLLLQGNGGGAQVSFTALVSLTDTAGIGVAVLNNAGAQLSFAALSVSNTVSGKPGLVADGGGTLNVANGALNVVGTGQPLSLRSMYAAVTLASVSARGTTLPAIALDTVSGTVQVLGDGTNFINGSGGTLQALAAGQAGVFATAFGSGAGTSALRFHQMQVLNLNGAPAYFLGNTSTAGSTSEALAALDVSYNRISGSASAGTTADGLVALFDASDRVSAFSFDGNRVDGVEGKGLLIRADGNGAVLPQVDVLGNTITNAAFGGVDISVGGFALIESGRSAGGVHIDKNIISADNAVWSRGDGIQLNSLVSGSSPEMSAVVGGSGPGSGNLISTNGSGPHDRGLDVAANGTGSNLFVRAQANSFSGNFDAGIGLSGAQSVGTAFGLQFSAVGNSFSANGASLAHEALSGATLFNGSICLNLTGNSLNSQAVDLFNPAGCTFNLSFATDITPTKTGTFGLCLPTVP